jgi:hypothetical protein
MPKHNVTRAEPPTVMGRDKPGTPAQFFDSSLAAAVNLQAVYRV